MARLPSNYQEVEYLQSSGTQWIDTGYTPNQDTTFEAKANLVSGNNFDGIAYIDSATYNAYGFFCFNNQLGCYYNSGYNISSGFVGVDKTYKLDKNLLYIDNSLVHTFNQTTFTSYGSLRLFAMRRTISNMGYAHTKLYYNKIWDNNTLVRNLIPCYRKSDSVAGMYDLTNSGKNLFDISNPSFNGYLTDAGVETTYSNSKTSAYISVLPNTTYTLSFTRKDSEIYDRVIGYNSSQELLSSPLLAKNTSFSGVKTLTFTTPSNCYYIRFCYKIASTNIQFELGSSKTEYEPYPFYTNSGTGTFIVGPDVLDGRDIAIKKEIIVAGGGSRLPSGYTEVEYLQSSGTQYIDTGMTGNLDTSYKIKATASDSLSNERVLFGTRTSATSRNISAFLPQNSGGSKVGVADFGNYNNTRASISVSANDTVELYCSKSLRQIDNITKGTTTQDTRAYSVSFTTANNLFIGKAGDGFASIHYNFAGYIYYAKIWQGEQLVRNFIPAYRKSDNVAGMYDIVNNQFYTNSGTGSFIVGPDVITQQAIPIKKSYIIDSNGVAIPIKKSIIYIE